MQIFSKMEFTRNRIHIKSHQYNHTDKLNTVGW